MQLRTYEKGQAMSIAELNTLLFTIGSMLWGWPLIGFVLASGLVISIACNWIQFRYFAAAWRYVFYPESSSGEMISPLQAFLNTLSASIGNGSLTGMATAIYSGGPGAAFWVFVLGFFTMPIRFAEVYAGTHNAVREKNGTLRGGPLAYIQLVPGGHLLVYVYVVFCLLLTFVGGNAMQCQAVTKGLTTMLPVSAYSVAAILFGFIVYVMLGGAQRVLKVSDMIVPVKVGLFFVSMVIALVFHYNSLIPALQLMIQGAFTPEALGGGLLGYTVQDAIRFSMARTLNATEAGIGTAGILYGGTGTKDHMRSGIMAMATSFISNHLVCFNIMWLIVASGAWQSGVNGTGLTILAYESVFGAFGGWVVTILSAMFGLGVLIAYAYIGRECWSFLTGGRYFGLYTAIYCSMALVGSLAEISLVWNSIDIAIAGLVIINLYALLFLLPKIRKAVVSYEK